jgi:hypothetical protein
MFDQIPWDLIGKAAAGLAGMLVLLWLYNRRERRRKTALEFADIMRDWGLKWFADGYRMYAVGDYSGLVYKIKEVIGAVRSDQVILAKLDEVFWKVLDHYKDQPEKAAEIGKRLEMAAKSAQGGATP